MTGPQFGRALRTRAGFQADIATYTAGDMFGLRTYKRGDPNSPDLSDDPMLGQETDNDRDATAPLVGMPNGSVQRTVPLALAEFGLWLSSTFGFPTTTGATGNFVHTFKSGAAALPFLTVEDLIMAGIYRRHRGVVVDGISVQATKENKYPDVVLDLLMRDSAKAAAALANDTAAALSVERPPAWGASVLWNNTPIGEATTASLNFKNNCDRWLGLSGDEFPVSIDPGLAAGSGSMTLRTVSDTYNDLAAAGGAPGKLSLVWKLPGNTVNRAFQWDFNLCRLTSQGQPVEGAGEITSNFTIRAEQGTAGNPMVTAILKNDVSGYALPEED